MSRFINPISQFSVQAGLLSGGSIEFLNNITSARKDTFSDADLTTANANPVILGDNGEIPAIFLAEDVSYKIVLRDSADVQIDTAGPIGVAEGTGAFAAWSATVTYNIPDQVTGSDLLYYKSITDANLNNDPISNPANWSQVTFNTVFNVNQTYGSGDQVTDLGILYTSREAANLGNTPSTSPTKWNPTNLAHMTAMSLSF